MKLATNMVLVIIIQAYVNAMQYTMEALIVIHVELIDIITQLALVCF